VIFEILAENIKIKLDSILTNNHQYKTDYYRFNRKKFLLSYCFEPNNATNEYEINAYLDEIVSVLRFLILEIYNQYLNWFIIFRKR
jgi:hypothetical protein